MLVKLYADEDCPGPVVRAERVLVTRDLGFGKLTVLRQLPAVGVVIIRMRGPGDWASRAPRVVAAMQQLGERAAGAISTIDWNATRTRPLPREMS